MKGFFKVNLKNYILLPTCYLPKVKDHFLHNNGIVTGSSLRDEAGLSLTNDFF